MEQEQFKREILPLRKQLTLYSRSFFENSEDVEDVVQEVMLKLWLRRKELHKYNSVQALSVEITKNLCLNRLKVLQRQMENVDNFTFESELPSPYAQLEQKDDVAQVMRIIDRLPTLQQTILRMRHIDGFEIDEIAAITGSAPEAIRMNLSRARKKVKEIFIKIQQL
jgi:RNA polymerase sigma-70 factor (ECF subfamily)